MYVGPCISTPDSEAEIRSPIAGVQSTAARVR